MTMGKIGLNVAKTSSSIGIVPGQHKKGLRLIGAYVDEGLYVRVKKAARENGKNVAEWLRQVIRDKVEPPKDGQKGL
jgi:hypothetical protein